MARSVMVMRGGINMESLEVARDPCPAPPGGDTIARWTPIEGECVAVVDYPSPLPLGVVATIERDRQGTPTTYWIWMLDDCRIALDASTVFYRLLPYASAAS
jgi:hypothetical protein